MDIQKWLERGQLVSDEIRQLQAAKKGALLEATASTQKWGGAKVSSGAKNTTENAFATVAELSLKIDRKIDELMKVKGEIIDAIYKVEDMRLRTLLIARYINLKNWETIAEELSYSGKWVRTKLHPRALEAIDRAIGA